MYKELKSYIVAYASNDAKRTTVNDPKNTSNEESKTQTKTSTVSLKENIKEA